MDIDNLEEFKECFFVEDVTDTICNLYKKFKDANAKMILSYPFYDNRSKQSTSIEFD